MGQLIGKLEKDITKKVHMDYLLYLPDGYENMHEKFPLIVFLHGSGERGDQIDAVKRHGIPKIVEQRMDFPFITVSPQCPSHSNWSVEKDALIALLDEVMALYSIDMSRIYLTGLSMGGYGTWEIAAEHPELFAAIAPICGGGNPAKAEALKKTPIWVFHGAKDQVVPLKESSKMVEAVNDCGGNVKFTIYPDAEHDSWTEAYNTPELYEWFLRHSK
jgi:predicted peptidase